MVEVVWLILIKERCKLCLIKLKACAWEKHEWGFQRRQSIRLHMFKVRYKETPKQITQRRQSDRLHKAKVRDEETPQQTNQRRKLNQLKMTMTRNVVSDEQSTERKHKDQLSKFKKRSKIQTVEKAVETFKSKCKKNSLST